MNDDSGVVWFLKAISKGFEVTPREVRLTFILVLGFILALIIFSLLQNWRHRRELKRRSKQVYEHLSEKYHLDSSDHDLITRMSKYLGRGERTTLLLLDRRVFDRTAEKIMEREGEPQSRIDDLRQTLQLGKVDPRMHGTKDLPKTPHPFDLVFRLQEGDFQVKGRIRRFSKDGTFLLLELFSLSESARQRLIKTLASSAGETKKRS